MHEVKLQKLREIFGADSALYINIKDCGGRFLAIVQQRRLVGTTSISTVPSLRAVSRVHGVDRHEHVPVKRALSCRRLRNYFGKLQPAPE